MASTTNYGWTTPDDTSLVKDGAAAIRTLGSSIDSTLKTQIDAQIPDNLLTTTGDVIYASGASTPARLGIGTTGQVLTVAGGLPTWAGAPASNSMTLLSTTNLSSTQTTVSSISQSYSDLIVVCRGWTYSANAVLFIKPNGLSTQSTYNLITSATVASSNSDGIRVTNAGTQAGAASIEYVLYIKNYSSTTYGKPFQAWGLFELPNSPSWTAGGINTASAITSMQVTTTAGTSTFTGGQILIYGVN